MPTAKARPAREMTLTVRPSRVMTMKVPTTEIGMAVATISVGRSERRKRISTRIARQPPTHRFCCTRSIAESMYSVSS